MTNTLSTKRALLTSIMALILCFTMLLGTTYAWFTDSVTSTGNKIQAGTLKIDLEMLVKDDVNNTTTWTSIKTSKAPIFDYAKWEPGYTDVKLLKVENEGNLAIKWKATIVSASPLSDLANVIDVYVLPYGVLTDNSSVVYPTTRDLTGYNKVGTVKEFVNTIETTTVGTLKAGEAAYLGIALKMQEEANNTYQNMDLGAFDIQILATQLDYEEDSIDENYDTPATFPVISSTVPVPDNATTSATAATEEASVELSANLLNALPAEVESIGIAHSEPKVDTTAGKVVFDQLELVDQNGKAIDLETLGNTEPITVKVYVGDVFADGAKVTIYHDGVEVATEKLVVDGYVTYTATHFCKVEVEEFFVKASTADELKAALSASAEKIALTADFTDLELNITKDTVIDLKGHTITDAYIKTEANVTIKNGSIKNTNEPYPLVVNKGTLTVDGLAIEASKSDRTIWIRENGTLNFNSGSILATKGENNTDSKIYGVWVAQGATANINGGSITVDGGANATAVGVFGNYQNTVNISGGRISTSGSTYSYGVWADGNITVSGGEIVTNENRYGYSSGITYGKNYAITGKGTVTITGGKITTNGPSGYLVNANTADQKVSISGVDFTAVLSEIDMTQGGHSAPKLVYKSENVTITSGSFTGVNDTFLNYVEAGATVTYNGEEITK